MIPLREVKELLNTRRADRIREMANMDLISMPKISGKNYLTGYRSIVTVNFVFKLVDLLGFEYVNAILLAQKASSLGIFDNIMRNLKNIVNGGKSKIWLKIPEDEISLDVPFTSEGDNLIVSFNVLLLFDFVKEIEGGFYGLDNWDS